MERVKTLIPELEKLLSEFNDTLEKKLPDVDFASPDSLRALLDTLYAREAMASRKKAKFKHKKASKLRKTIADLLLLHEGKDYQKKDEQAEQYSAPEDTTEVTS